MSSKELCRGAGTQVLWFMSERHAEGDLGCLCGPQESVTKWHKVRVNNVVSPTASRGLEAVCSVIPAKPTHSGWKKIYVQLFPKTLPHYWVSCQLEGKSQRNTCITHTHRRNTYTLSGTFPTFELILKVFNENVK